MAKKSSGGAKAPSERTYGQRYVKGVKIYDLVKGEAGYDPKGNPLIVKATLRAFLDGLGAANKQVADLEPLYSKAQDTRLDMYHGAEGLIQRAVRVRDVIGGLLGGKKSTAYGTVQRIVQEMRDYQKPKKEVADGTDPVPDAPSTAQTSFGSLLLKGQEVLGVMKDATTKYVTGNALVTVAAFEQFLTDLEAQDTVVTDALTPLNKAIKARVALFEGPEGLQERVVAVKSYVAGEMEGGKKSDLHKELVKVRYQ